MQTKTIAKAIGKKMEEWLTTITDEDLRTRVRKHLLVTGGCITSMFLGEDVNDYDVYMQDRQTLLDLVEYYVKGEESVLVLDYNKKEEYKKNADSYYHDEESKSDMTNIWTVTLDNLKEDQVKLFFKGAVGKAIDTNPDKTYQVSYLSPNAISLTDNVQIVLRFHGTPEEIHKSFDFIHATNYYTTQAKVVLNLAAVESILSKQLRYQGSYYPVTSIIRVKKFLKRNWNITAGEQLKIIFQVSQLNLTDVNVLEEQLTGVDVAYFGVLINALRNVKVEITPEYINTMIDRIFNEADSDI